EGVGRDAENGGRVGTILQSLEQVLEQERVWPAELIVSRGNQDLRARERDECVARVHAERADQCLQDFAANVLAEGGCGVCGETQIRGHGAKSLVPQLARGYRPTSQRAFGHRVLVSGELQISAARPRVEKLQCEERVTAALLHRVLYRRIVERDRRREQ